MESHDSNQTPECKVESGAETLSDPCEARVESASDESHHEGPKNHLVIPKHPLSSASSRGWRFWAVLLAICLATLLIALEATIPTASVPTISSELGAGDNWVWIVNGYLLSK